MKITLLATAVLVAAKTFGAAPTITTAPIHLAEAVKPANLGKPVLVEAAASEVCQKEGCWLTLREGATSIHVSFKDYGFFVPKDVAGKTLLVEGTLAEEKISEEDLRDHAADAGASKEQVEKIHGEKKEVTMVATSVRVK
jgi:hypothetical protein